MFSVNYFPLFLFLVVEKERKRKLNPKRVGANFDHSAETSEDWLPSFGRVWNHGPRWRSRYLDKIACIVFCMCCLILCCNTKIGNKVLCKIAAGIVTYRHLKH